MYHNSVHLLVSPNFPIIWLNLPKRKQNKQANKQKQQQKLIKQKRTKNTQNSKTSASPSLLPLHHLSIYPDSIGGFGVSYSMPVCPISLTGNFLFEPVIGLVQRLWFLVHHPHWIFTRAPFGYPEFWEFVGIVPQDQSLHKFPQRPRWGRC